LPHLVQLSQRFCNSVEQIVQELMSILLIRTAEHFCMKLTIMYKQQKKKRRCLTYLKHKQIEHTVVSAQSNDELAWLNDAGSMFLWRVGTK
jgi:hypothetical protein